jgi:type VI secretion system protein ImpL
MLGKILKVLLIIVLLAALSALAYWVCLLKAWPWWVAVILVAGVLGLWTGFVFARKYLLRSRERKFVQRVIEQDTAAIAKAPVTQRHQLQELQEHWKESVTRLQNSHLRKRGNPLYVLPWYLILGDTGVGKTSAVRNAGLSSPMTEVRRAPGVSGTRNCDWWFLEKAIILDTAGRYTIPVEEVQDLEEWKQFLALLARYRKKEPLNGVLVAVGADSLLAANEKKLREDGQMIRRRIDQIMRVVGARFPVYVLVTKMDLVHGFTEFARHLPPGSLSQAMGYNNLKNAIFWLDVLNEGMQNLGEKLRRLRFALVQGEETVPPGTILFPQEFARLRPGLEAFLKAVFEENPYQENPLLRGLYFTSALREGVPNSPFLEELGIQAAGAETGDPGEGLFLKDLFDDILPKDRDLFGPITEFVTWNRLTRSLGLFSWLLIGLAVCGLLTLSFYLNTDAIQGFREDFFDPPRLTKDPTTDLMMLDKMRVEILEMEEKNRFWLIPRLGLGYSRWAVGQLKKHYSRLFREGFLLVTDTRLYERIAQVNENTPEEEFVDYVGYVVARITLLKEHLAGKKLTLEKEFRKITASLMETISPQMALAPEIASKFGDVYYAYLSWSHDRANTEERLAELRVALIQLLDKKGSDLQWLTRKWVPGVPDIHLHDLWGTREIGEYRGRIVLPGAYTAEGRKHMEEFITLIEAALDGDKEKTLFEKRKAAFWVWYRQEFFHAWLTFMEGFHQGLNHLDTVAGWQRMASLMTTPKNPYFKLLDKAADEINLLRAGKGEVPPWAEMVTRIKQIQEVARTEKEKEKGGSLTARLKEKEEQLKGAALEKVDREKEQERARDLDEKLQQAKAWNEYMETLAKINVGVSSRKECYDMYSGSFSYMEHLPASEQSPFAIAYSSYYKLRGLLNGRRDFPEIWDLLFGPLDFVMAYASDETACFLQAQWEEQVLGVLQGADPGKVSRALFSKTDGAVWKFLGDTARPFIGRNESGYYSRRDFRRHSIPFKPEFIQFLNQGSEGVINYESSYTVSMETLPLDVNDEAKEEPYACVLVVNCADGKMTLENYNFPSSASFTWSPDKCGDVSLTLSLPQLTLQRAYKGTMWFAQFLREFRDGSRTFSAEDFPDRKEDLKAKGISWIKVSYRIKGGEPVVRLLTRVPTQVPTSIVTCLARSKG